VSGTAAPHLAARAFAVIPAYNPGAAVIEVARGAAGVLGAARVVVVDDGSADGAAARAADAGVRVVRHPENRGKGAALRTGFAIALESGADWVLTLDADGQHEPGEIPRFLEEAEQGRFDLLLGDRMSDTGRMPIERILANRLTSSIISMLAGQRIRDSQSGFRLITAKVLRAVDLRFDRFDAESEILVKAARAGFRIGAVAIGTIYGEETSTIRPMRDTLRFVALVLKLMPVALRGPRTWSRASTGSTSSGRD
jgi:glycosyltransferase involved in cell wall biosynthesis